MEDHSVLHLFLGHSVPQNLLMGTCIVGQWASEWGIMGQRGEEREPPNCPDLGLSLASLSPPT